MQRSRTRVIAVAALALLIIVAAILLVADGDAKGQAPTPTPTVTATPTPKPEPPTYWERGGCKALVKKGKFRRAVKKIYRHSVGGYGGNYIARPKVTGDQRKRLARKARCASNGKVTRHRRDKIAEERDEWKLYRYLDQITPYGEWAIPSYIVYCESKYSYTVVNSIGAEGAYQVIPSTEDGYNCDLSWPGGQHICARRIMDAAGSSQWDCA